MPVASAQVLQGCAGEACPRHQQRLAGSTGPRQNFHQPALVLGLSPNTARAPRRTPIVHTQRTVKNFKHLKKKKKKKAVEDTGPAPWGLHLYLERQMHFIHPVNRQK